MTAEQWSKVGRLSETPRWRVKELVLPSEMSQTDGESLAGVAERLQVDKLDRLDLYYVSLTSIPPAQLAALLSLCTGVLRLPLNMTAEQWSALRDRS